MKKDKHSPLSKSIHHFQFHILPISVSSPKPCLTSFFIYVEKGAQVIGKIDQPISPSPIQSLFDKTHLKRFRVANDKNLTYNWSLYRLTSQDQEEYVESVPFNIKSQFDQYIKDFDKIQTDLFRIFHEKEKKNDIQEIWKDLRHDIKSQLQITTLFPKLSIKLVFKVKINCEYDFMYQRWEEQKQRRKYEKKTSIIRRASTQSKNSMFKTPSQVSLNEHKQKNPDPHAQSRNPQQNKTQSIDKVVQIKHQEQQEPEEVRQSEIRITSPEGVDLTMDIPEKFLNNRKAMEDEFYYMKKTSMLSDIIEQSYEGSSNANMIKSNQGQRLKSVDIIVQEEEPMFSPMIKTQTFESQKHQAYFNEIKRTATLAHKHSQQFQLEETPKTSNKKISQSPNKSGEFDNYNQKETINVSPNLKMSGRGSLEVEEQEKQIAVDFSEAKRVVIKNAIKVFFIVVLLVLAVNIVSIFERRQIKSYSQSRTHKNSKDLGKKQDKIQKPTKSKPFKTKS